MTRYRLSRQADADLDAIAEHVAAENPRAALGNQRNLRTAFSCVFVFFVVTLPCFSARLFGSLLSLRSRFQASDWDWQTL